MKVEKIYLRIAFLFFFTVLHMTELKIKHQSSVTQVWSLYLGFTRLFVRIGYPINRLSFVSWPLIFSYFGHYVVHLSTLWENKR